MFPPGPTSDAVALWKSVLNALAKALPASALRGFDHHTRCLELAGSRLRIAAHADELAAWMRSGYLREIVREVEVTGGGRHTLAIVPVPGGDALDRDPFLDLDSFIASPANASVRRKVRQFAADASSRPGGLLLQGPCGSGKTHLLRATAGALSEKLVSDRILLLGSERMSLDLVGAIRNDQVERFRADLGEASALLLDDIDRLEGRDATQEVLLSVLTELGKRGAPVVMSGSRPIEYWSGLSDGLSEAAGACTQIRLEVPEWETRVAIALDHIERWPVDTALETASLFASHLGSSLDRIDEVLTTLMARFSPGDDLKNAEFVRHILVSGGRGDFQVAPNRIVSLVARHFDLRIKEFRSATRSRRVAVPRQIAMFLMRRHCSLSYPEIGRLFGRHHTTAIHAFRLIQRRVEQQETFRSTVALLEKEILNQLESDG